MVKILDFGLAESAGESRAGTERYQVADAVARNDAGGNDPGHCPLHVFRTGPCKLIYFVCLLIIKDTNHEPCVLRGLNSGRIGGPIKEPDTSDAYNF